METSANDTVIVPPSTVPSSPSASLIRTVFTVAWMSVLLGVGLELLLIALAAGAGTASKFQPYAALGLILGWMLKKAWSGAWSFMAVGLGAGVIFGGTIIGLMDWHAAKALAPVALATRAISEILFPVGCALVLYAADSLSKWRCHDAYSQLDPQPDWL